MKVIVALMLAACSSPAQKPEAPTRPTPEPAPTPAPSGPAALDVVAAPDGIDAAAIFDGRVLATGDRTEVFCATSYFDADAGAQVHWVDLVACSNAEDEVGIFWVEGKTPTRQEAEAELGSRLDGCLEEPLFLEMARWPEGAEAVVAQGWELEARREGNTLSLVIGGAETGVEPRWDLEVPPGHRIDSLHLDAANGTPSFAVVRTRGVEDGKPVVKCQATEIFGGAA